MVAEAVESATWRKQFPAPGLEHLVAHFGDNTAVSILADMRRFAEEVRPALT